MAGDPLPATEKPSVQATTMLPLRGLRVGTTGRGVPGVPRAEPGSSGASVPQAAGA